MALFPAPPTQEDRQQGQTVTYGQSWRLDLSEGDFPLIRGSIELLTGHESWVQWCAKAALTDRLHHPIYPTDYGTDWAAVRSAAPRAAQEAEIERVLTEALMVDPRTLRVSGWAIEITGDEAQVTALLEPTIGTAEELDVERVM